jgi:hypothetical protein
MTADTLARHDGIKWKAHATVEKWDGDQVAYVTEKTGVLAPSGNLLTTAGLTRLTALLIASGSPQALTNTSVRLGVGNGSTAAAIGDTDLAAASGSGNRYFMTMDATFPSVAAGVLTAKATFGASDGNFVWAEWCIDIGAPTVSAGTTVNACMFNRKVAALGTKANPAVWALTATITIS